MTVTDITNPPVPPPHVAAQVTAEEAQIPSGIAGTTVRQLFAVADSTRDPQPYVAAYEDESAEAPAAPTCAAAKCGYATATDFKALKTKFSGAGLEHSLIKQ